MKKYKIGYTTGVFDMFHVGHLNILARAKQLCDYLVVGVTTDELCYQRKQKYPVIPQEDRVRIVSAIRYVDEVILQENMNKIEQVKKKNVDVVFVGSDWKGTEAWQNYEKEFAAVGCSVVYLDHTNGISSSELRQRIMEKEG